MAKVLLLTGNLSHVAYTRTRDAIIEQGNTVIGSDATTVTGLDSAFADAAPDIIATVMSPSETEFRDWVTNKWNSGVPLLLGGWESGSVGNVSNHLAMHMGLSLSATVTSSSSWTNAMSVRTEHPSLGGATGLVTIYSGSSSTIRLAVPLGEGVDIAGWRSSGSQSFMSAWDEGDLTYAGQPAPAKLVFIGWLYGGSLDYYPEAKDVIGATIDWLTPEIDPDITVAGTVADTSAEMLDAEFSNIGHVKITTESMTAEARSGYHEVFGDRAPYTRRVLAPPFGTYRYYSGWQYTSGDFSLPAGSEADFVIRVPDGRIDPTDTVSTRTLRLARISGSGGHGVSAYIANGNSPSFTMGTALTGGTLSGGVFTLNVPLSVTQVYLRISNSGYNTQVWDTPGNDNTSDQSYFTVSAAPVPVTRITASAAHASALGVDPTLDITANILRYVTATSGTAEALTAGVTVQTAADISMQATPATAEGFMPKPTMPNVGVFPDAALGAAAMNTTWFSSEVRANVAYAEADAEMLDYAEIMSDDNIVLNAGVATARAAIREPWLSINDVEVDRNHIDPYWQRVARRSTEGYLPPSASQWFRLNQRTGNVVEGLSSAGTVLPNGHSIIGDYAWGAAGPHGKRGLAVRDAAFGNTGESIYFPGDYGEWSLEFTLRVEPGHRGRMDIATGRSRPEGGYPGGRRSWHTSVRDGRIYSATAYGGTSVRRIDDGEWHHVVITVHPTTVREYAGQGYTNQRQWNLAIYIDGELDRMLTSEENTSNSSGGAHGAPATRFLGGGTDYPFQGEILDIVTRRSIVSHEVKELYLDMFGFKAMRAGAPMTASGDAFQGHKAVSSMKRMLLISWMPLSMLQDLGLGWSAHNDNGWYKHSITAAGGALSPMLGYGWDDEMDVGRYLVTVQMADRVGARNASGVEGANFRHFNALKQEVLDENQGWQLVDQATGRRRMLDLVNDIDLDEFDVIAFQAYPNKQYTDMHDRQMHEAFLESVRKALVMGKKMWINDPYLAADLGLISDVEMVPVLGRVFNGIIRAHDRYGFAGGPDVRGYEVAPFIGLEGGKFPKPADGSLPVIHRAIPEGSQFGVVDIWGGDVHHNNGYRVVNEIEGLTDIPTWELDEMFWRDRTNMLPQNDDEYQKYGYRLENRTGIDYEWGPADGSDNYPAKKESKGTGLKAGDEFYDYYTFDRVVQIFWRGDDWLEPSHARNGRTFSTYGVPPGHLRVGTPVTTFRRTLWNDYGDEISNPYRDFIRNAVIRPGDRLPDGRKVNGYVYMDFAEHPSFGGMAGRSITKQLTGLPGVKVGAVEPENEYTFDWDYVSTVRRSFTGRGSINSVQVKFHYGPRHSNGAIAMASKGEIIDWPLPLAPTISESYATISLPHMTWNSRGISWLTMVDVEDAEVALAHQDGSAQADAGMVSPMVEVDFDNEVSVGAAQASGRIVDPDETVLKSTNVLAYAATARGTMTGLQGGYKAEAATSFGDMPQNVRRPLDIEEVLFFTVSFTQETIYVRMEEN